MVRKGMAVVVVLGFSSSYAVKALSDSVEGVIELVLSLSKSVSKLHY